MRLEVITTQDHVAAPGHLRWTTRITNLTSKPLTGLRIAESVAVAGSPGFEGTEQFIEGGCVAATGTAYCPLPRLEPGRTITAPGEVFVPLRFHHGPNTVGNRVDTFARVVDEDFRSFSNVQRLHVPITRTTLPFTGGSLQALLIAGLTVLVAGVATMWRSLPRQPMWG